MGDESIMGYSQSRKMRVTAVLTLLLFLFSTFINPRTVSAQVPVPTLSPHAIQLPATIANIRETFQAPAAGSPLVIHVQDAHLNYEAQKNISNILASLQRTYGVDTVFIEGTAGELNTSLLRAFPFEEEKRKIVERYMQKGRLSGAEEYSIISEKPVALYGIDDTDTYLANVAAYLEAAKVQDSARTYLAQIESALKAARPRVLSAGVLSFLAQKEAFLAQESDNPLVYTRYLIDACHDNDIDISRYTHFKRLAELEVFQSKIEVKEIVIETRALIDNALIGLLSDADMNRLALAELDFQGGRLSPYSYYGTLKELSLASDIDFRSFQNINRYYHYLSLVNDIDATKLMEERERIEKRLLSRLVSGTEEKDFLRLTRNFEVLKNIISLQAIPEDLTYFRKHEKEFTDDMFAHIDDGKTRSIASLLPVFKDFYRLAESREDAFVEKTIRQMKERKLSTAVLMAGGYHTAGLEKRFQDKDISYMVVSPRLSELPEVNMYDKIMRSYDKYFGVKEGKRAGTVKELSSINPEISRPEYQALLGEIIPELSATIDDILRSIEMRRDRELPNGVISADEIKQKLSSEANDIFTRILQLHRDEAGYYPDFPTRDSREAVFDRVVAEKIIMETWNAMVRGRSILKDESYGLVRVFDSSDVRDMITRYRSVGAADIRELDEVPQPETEVFEKTYRDLQSALIMAFPGAFTRPMTALKYVDTAIEGDDANRAGALDIVSGNIVEIGKGMEADAEKLLFSWGTLPIIIPREQISTELKELIGDTTDPKALKKKLIPYVAEKMEENGIHVSAKQVRSDSLPLLRDHDVLLSYDSASLIPVVDKEGNLQMHAAFWFRDAEASYAALERMNERIAQIHKTTDAPLASSGWYYAVNASDSASALNAITVNNWKFYADFRRGEYAAAARLAELIEQIQPEEIVDPAAYGIYYDQVLGQAASKKDDGSDTGIIGYGKNREAFLSKLDSVGILFHRLNNLVMPGYDTTKDMGMPVPHKGLQDALISLYYRMNAHINTIAQDHFNDISMLEPVRIKISKFAAKLNRAVADAGALELNTARARKDLVASLEANGVSLSPEEIANIEAVYTEYAKEDFLWAYDVMQFAELVSEETFVKAFPHITVFQYQRKLMPQDREYEVVDGSGRIATVSMVLRFIADMNARQEGYVSQFAIRTRSIKAADKSDFAVREVRQMFMDDVIRNAGLKLQGEALNELLDKGLISFEAEEKLSARLDFGITDAIPSVYPVSIVVRGQKMGIIYFVDSSEFEAGLRLARDDLPNIPRPMIIVDENGTDIYFGTSTDATPGSVHIGDQKAVAERTELKARGEKPKLTMPTLWEMYDVDEISEEHSFAGVGDMATEYERLREIISRVDEKRLADSGRPLTIDPAQISKLLLLRGFHAVGENIDKVLKVKETGVQFLTPTSCSTNGASYFLQALVVLAGHLLSMSGPTGHMYTGGDKAGVPGHLYPKDTGAASGVGMNIFDADAKTLETIANYLFGAVRTPTPVKDGEHVIVGGSLYTKLLLRMPVAIPQEVIISYLDRIAQEYPGMLRMFDEEDKVDGKYVWEKAISGQQTGSILFADLITKIMPEMLEIFVGYDNEGSFSFKDAEVKRTLDLARTRQKDIRRRSDAVRNAKARAAVSDPKSIKRIGILTGGGPASGHNNLIASVLRKARAMGDDVEIIAIRRGWDGLVNPESVREAGILTEAEIEDRIGKGGTLLRTSRTNAFNLATIEKYAPELMSDLTREERVELEAYRSLLTKSKKGTLSPAEKEIFEQVETTIIRPRGAKMLMRNIEALELDALIAAGGDDTSGAASKLQAEYAGFPVIAVPKTMDNDISLPHGVPTYGYDSFVKAGIEQAKRLSQSADALQRIMIVETFGRKAGFVQLKIGEAIGAARTLVPEEGTVDLQELIDDLERYYYANGEKAVVLVSEGIKVKLDEKNAYLFNKAWERSPVAREAFERDDIETDEFGHPKLKDAARIVAAILNAAFKERGSNIPVSLVGKIDYAEREADTSVRDLAMTKKLGEAAVENLFNGMKDAILYVAPDGTVESMSLQNPLSGRVAKIEKGQADHELYQAANRAVFRDYQAPKTVPAIEVLAQNVTVTQGAQTGEVFIGDIIEDGAAGIIVGHSEVRLNFANATEAVFNAQIREAIKRNMKRIIYCVGESQEEKQSGRSEEVIETQLRQALEDVSAADVAEKLVIAYEPRWAIAGSGLGEAADENTAQYFAHYIRGIVADMFGQEVAAAVRIQYGGSATKENARAYLSQPDVDGLLVGSKSTTVAEFLPIVRIAAEIGPKSGRVPHIGANWKTYPIKSEYYEFADALSRIDHDRVDVGIAPSLNRITRVVETMADVAERVEAAPAAEETAAQEKQALVVKGLGSISTIDDIDFNGKRVLQRVDFNVPVSVDFTDEGEIDLNSIVITDANRIRAELRTLQEIFAQNPKYITLITHFEPKIKKPGMKKAAKTGLPTQVIAAKLQELMPEMAGKIEFVADSVDEAGLTVTREDLDRINARTGAKIFVLDQIRFAQGETTGDQVLRDQLADLGDVYVNDGFAAFHREHASMTVDGIGEKAVGRLVEYEVANLSKAFAPRHPMAAIFGGSKVEDKVDMIYNFIDSMRAGDTIMIVGAMAYTFMKAEDPSLEIGNSMFFEDQVETAARVMAAAQEKGITLMLPLDHTVATDLGQDNRASAFDTEDRAIAAGTLAVDIGPRTRQVYTDVLENANTVVWNGPAGVFEAQNGAYIEGSRAIAEKLAERAAAGADVIVGGGDTGSCIKASGVDPSRMFISTAGGASFAFLSTKGNMPVLRQFSDTDVQSRQPLEKERAQSPAEIYEEVKDAYVIWSDQAAYLDHADGKSMIGGKSLELAISKETFPSISLPTFSGTAKACMDFLESKDGLLDGIYDIVRTLDTSDDQARARAYAQIYESVVATPVPEGIQNDIKGAYWELCDVSGIERDTLMVAIRSSGKAEDVQIKSERLKGVSLGANAGQHDSFLGVIGADEVVERWKQCIASLFTERVLDYRDGIMVFTAFDRILSTEERADEIISTLAASDNKNDRLAAKAFSEGSFEMISSMQLHAALLRNGFTAEAAILEEQREEYIKVDNIAMGVTFMPMADADLSFVNFGADLNSGWTGMTFQEISSEEYKNKGRVFTISITNKIGEAIVQGVTTPDVYLVHVFTDADGEVQANILQKALGTKTIKAVYARDLLEELGLESSEMDDLLDAYEAFENNTWSARDLEKIEASSVHKKVFARTRPNYQHDFRMLKKLMSVKVDQTDDVAIDAEEIADSFRMTRAQINTLAHLMKELKEDRTIPTVFTNASPEEMVTFAAADSQVRRIALEVCMPMAENYGKLIDNEGAVGFNNNMANQPINLQRRPHNDQSDVDNPDVVEISYTYVDQKDLAKVRAEGKRVSPAIAVGDELVQGIPTRNAFSGEIYYIDVNKDLVPQFEAARKVADSGTQLIIRCKETTPDFVSLLKHENVKGVIADVGGPTSHAAVISRELKIATVVGIQTFLNKMASKIGEDAAIAFKRYLNTTGNIVTVDANMDRDSGLGTVYAGEMPISQRTITIDTTRLPYIFTKFGYIMGLPHPMLEMTKIPRYPGYKDVVLMRGEFSYAEENINPRAGAAYDNALILTALQVYENPKLYAGLYPEMQQAYDSFLMHHRRRDAQRARGIEVEMDVIERSLERFLSAERPAEEFFASLSEYERSDVELLSTEKHAHVIKEITQMLSGYISYREFFTAIHGGSVSTMAAANSLKNTIKYRSIDFKKNEAREYIGSTMYDPEPEVATMIGERGARWILQPENQVILREEIKALLKSVHAGYENISIFFPFVATPGELDELMVILREEEVALSRVFGKPIYFREVGMMVELPSNVVLADEYIAVLERHKKEQIAYFQEHYDITIDRKVFLSFGTNDLTQLTLGADRDNPEMKAIFTEAHRYVIESIKYVASRAKNAGIACCLCGNALANLALVDPVAAEEILMILGSTGGSIGTDYLGTETAIIRSASATLRNGKVTGLKKSDTLVDRFESKLDKGAAARPAYVITWADDFEKTYIGDFAVIPDVDEVELDLKDETTKIMLERLGAVILYDTGSVESNALIAMLNALRVPIVRLGQNTIGMFVNNIRDGETIIIDFEGDPSRGINKGIYRDPAAGTGRDYRLGHPNVEVIVPELESAIERVSEDAPVASIEFDQTLRINDFYMDENGLDGLHPLVFLAYDNVRNRAHFSAETKEKIEMFISGTGTESAREAYIKALSAYIRFTVEQNKVGRYLIETTDIESDDFSAMEGFETLSQIEDWDEEINPPLGLAGIDSLTRHEMFNQLFAMEMEAVLDVITRGYYNTSIQFNSVKLAEMFTGYTGTDKVEIAGVNAVLERVGIDTSEIKVGMNTAWPGNYLFTREFIEKGNLSFITIDRRKLAQAFLAAHIDGKNESVTAFYTDEKILEAIIESERMIKNAAFEAGIPVRIVGLDGTVFTPGDAPQPQASSAKPHSVPTGYYMAGPTPAHGALQIALDAGHISAEVAQNVRMWLHPSVADQMVETYDVGTVHVGTFIEELIFAENWKELSDRFFKVNSFGTAGVRGTLTIGSALFNRINLGIGVEAHARYITQAYDEYLQEEITRGNTDLKEKAVILGYDSRIGSLEQDVPGEYGPGFLVRYAASIYAAHGIKVYLFDREAPTPEVSFAVNEIKELGIQPFAAGIFTASHNPSPDNGFKPYDMHGGQIVHGKVADISQEITDFAEVQAGEYAELVEAGMIEIVGPQIDAAYIEKENQTAINVDQNGHFNEKIDDSLTLVFSSLNGTSHRLMAPVLKRRGFDIEKNLYMVDEQTYPDGRFPTAPQPNPENKAALDHSVRLANEKEADILIATDPDADRLGVGIRMSAHDKMIFAGDAAVKDGYYLLNGNMQLVVLLDYIVSQLAENGKMTPNSVVGKTIVSSPLMKSMVEAYQAAGHDISIFEPHVGFKFFGEKLDLYAHEAMRFAAEVNDPEFAGRDYSSLSRAERATLLSRYSLNFIFGGEESYGSLIGDYVKDKDAITVSAMFVELAGYWKKQGKTVTERIQEIYEEFGYSKEVTFAKAYPGALGNDVIKAIMADFRANPLTEVAGKKVIASIDYRIENGQVRQAINPQTGEVLFTDEEPMNPAEHTGYIVIDGVEVPHFWHGDMKVIGDKARLGSANVLMYVLEDGSKVIVRPSGTEPKIKYYVLALGSQDKAMRGTAADKSAVNEFFDKAEVAMKTRGAMVAVPILQEEAPEEDARLFNTVGEAGVDVDDPFASLDFEFATPADELYARGLYQKYLNLEESSRAGEKKAGLVIGKNFFPSAMLSKAERRGLMGALEYDDLVSKENHVAARSVHLVTHEMNGGLGTSVSRATFLENLREAGLIERTNNKDGKINIAAKGTDLFYAIELQTTSGRILPKMISVTELKLLRLLATADEYKQISIQHLVNDESRPWIDAFFEQPYLFDLLDDSLSADEVRTYGQYIEDLSSADIREHIEQQQLPTIDLEKRSLSTDRVAPGGHGHIGTMLLGDVLEYQQTDPDTVEIHSVYNGDGTNNSADSQIAGWMARENVPVVMLSTTKTGLDLKGGQIGIEKTADGKVRTQMCELAQAEQAGQKPLFFDMGIKKGEPNKQFFNTNVALINYTALAPFLRDLKELIGDDQFKMIITPDLIKNEKKQDGRTFVQLEGALGSALLNLNGFLEVTDDQKVKDLMAQHGIEKLLRIVNSRPEKRTDFFTPIKFAFDFWMQAFSDHFQVDTDTWTVANMREGHLPQIGADLLTRKYYKDVQNCIDAFGRMSTIDLDYLNIVIHPKNGIIHMPDVTLRGKVVIDSKYEGLIDLTEKAELRDLLGAASEHELVLEDVHIFIDEDGTIDVYPVDTPSDALKILAFEGFEEHVREVYGIEDKSDVEDISEKMADIGFDGTSSRLGWGVEHIKWILDNPHTVEQVIADAEAIRARSKYAVFMGMGGSGLSVQKVKTTFGESDTKIYSLRTTDPAAIKAILDEIVAREGGDLKAALEATTLIGISKSWTTAETMSHIKYFKELYAQQGLTFTDHMWAVTDKGSPGDTGEFPQREIQLNGKGDIGGRFTAPATNVFLLPLAITRPDLLEDMQLFRRALEMNDIAEAEKDPFLDLAAFLFSNAIHGRDKVTVIVPEELRDVPLWAEQLFEESLGKDGKGLTLIYGEDLGTKDLRPLELNDRVFVRISLGDKKGDQSLWRAVTDAGYETFDVGLESLVDIGGLQLGLERAVLAFAYLWDICAVDQPAVEGYKRETRAVMAEFEARQKTDPSAQVEVPADWKSARSDSVELYYTPLLEAGVITESRIEHTVEYVFGRTMDDAAAVYAATLMLLDFEAMELMHYGKTSPDVFAVLQDARTAIFTRGMRVPSKLGEGPDKNHSFHQNIEGGKDMWYSTYIMPKTFTQPTQLSYDDNLIKAQTIGTVNALAQVNRKVALLVADTATEKGIADLDRFFDTVAELLGYTTEPLATVPRFVEDGRRALDTFSSSYQAQFIADLVQAEIVKKGDTPENWQMIKSFVTEIIAPFVTENKDIEAEVVVAIMDRLKKGVAFHKQDVPRADAPKAGLGMSLAYLDAVANDADKEAVIAGMRSEGRFANYAKVVVYARLDAKDYVVYDALAKKVKETAADLFGISPADVILKGISAERLETVAREGSDYGFLALSEFAGELDTINLLGNFAETETPASEFEKAVRAVREKAVDNAVRIIAGDLGNALSFASHLALVKKLFVVDGTLEDIEKAGGLRFTDEAKKKLGFILANPPELAQMMQSGTFIADEIRKTIQAKVEEALRAEIIATFA